MNHRTQPTTSTKLLHISKVSASNHTYKFKSLASLLNEEYLAGIYAGLNRSKASGIDQVSVKQYGENLDENLRSLVNRMKQMSYRPQAVKRVYIPKASGGERPLGIPTVEDRLVQSGISRILEAIYEPYFIEESYGFRRGRSCHDAIRRLSHEMWVKPINYVIDADIKGFFDNVNHEHLIRFIEHRVEDNNLVRLIIRFLKSGVMESGEIYKTEKGTPQGGNISPVLANIYLHYVLDLWFKYVVRPNLKGYSQIIRYADDFLILVEKEEDCEVILSLLKERLAKFDLELSAEKTKLVRFSRRTTRANQVEQSNGTFDFLGFTFYIGKSRRGKTMVCWKTSKSRFRRGLQSIKAYLKSNRNRLKLQIIWKLLVSKLRGHYNYYGISGNGRSISIFYDKAVKLIFKWLNRRSQRRSFTWVHFSKYLKSYPLPTPKIYVRVYS